MAPPQDLLRYPGQVRDALGDAGSIDARCTGLVPVAEMVSQPVAGKMVGERGERALRFPAGFRCYPFQCCCHGMLPSWLGVQNVFPSLRRDRVALARCMLCGPLPPVRGSPTLRVLWVRPTSYGSSRETGVAHACLIVTGPACGLPRKPSARPSPRRFLCLRAVGLNPGRARIDSPWSVYAGVAFPCGGQGRPLRPRSISGLCSPVRKLAPARRLPVDASPRGLPPLGARLGAYRWVRP